MKDFVAAVQESDAEVEEAGEERESITFKHEGTDVTFYKPTSGQGALLFTLNPRNMSRRDVRNFLAIFFNMMDEDTQDYFDARLTDPLDPFSNLDSPNGIFDIFTELSKEWSGGKATKQPSDYQRSRRATGPGSTAPTRRKTSSASRSAGS